MNPNKTQSKSVRLSDSDLENLNELRIITRAQSDSEVSRRAVKVYKKVVIDVQGGTTILYTKFPLAEAFQNPSLIRPWSLWRAVKGIDEPSYQNR